MTNRVIKVLELSPCTRAAHLVAHLSEGDSLSTQFHPEGGKQTHSLWLRRRQFGPFLVDLALGRWGVSIIILLYCGDVEQVDGAQPLSQPLCTSTL